jgi:hypothetical protein
VEIIQAGEPARSGRDGVSGLAEELADVADALVDRFGPDAEQGGDGDLGQGETLVEDGGQEPVGEGEDRAAAGAGGGQPRAVAAAGVQACLPLLVVRSGPRRFTRNLTLAFATFICTCSVTIDLSRDQGADLRWLR